MMERCRYTEWCYRSEGNCNMLFANSKSHRVYRILKVNVDHRNWQNHHERQSVTPSSIRCHYIKLVQYSACVMEHLYSSYMSVPRLRSVSIRFLEDISHGVNNERPAARLGKEISLCPMVLDIPDYAFLPPPFYDQTCSSFMFELKAGSVVRTASNILMDQSYGSASPRCSISKSYCYFCINKSLDHQHKPSRMCRYCPQELFSGNVKRMRRCISYMLEDMTCPGSKLRLFKDGVDITKNMDSTDGITSLFSPYFHSNNKSDILKELISLLMKCLTHSKPSVGRRRSLPTILPAHSALHSCSHCLANNCVLSTFLNAQYYGAATVEEIQSAFDVLESHIAKEPTLVSKLCIDGPYDTGLWRLSDRPDKPAGVSNEVFSAFIQVRNYLIYRTAKDASVLITFQPKRQDLMPDSDENSAVFQISNTLGNEEYLCNAAIIDLDLKPFSKMEAYLKKEWAIFDHLVDSERNEV